MSLKLMKQLCSGGIPAGLSAEFQTIFRSAPVSAPAAVAAAIKLCPKCNIPFSEVTKQFYHCGKSTNAYNIYKCKQCKNQNLIGEYSDMERLRPEGSRLFQMLNDDIRLAEWTLKEKNGRPYWTLRARGQTWTRCNDPKCRALYKYYRGKSLQRTAQKHQQTIKKLIKNSESL